MPEVACHVLMYVIAYAVRRGPGRISAIGMLRKVDLQKGQTDIRHCNATKMIVIFSMSVLE